MFPVASLLTALLFAIPVATSPAEVHAPQHIYANGGATNLVQHDRARATALKGRGAVIQSRKFDRRLGNVLVTNAGVSYIASVGVGSPAATYHLIVDTASANTWVGSGKPYVKTSTSEDTGQPAAGEYGSSSFPANFSGEEWLDTVTLSSDLVITKQSIGVANSSVGFINVDGVLGIGPVDLTLGILTNEPLTTIPTVTENLYNQCKIPKNIVSVFFAPSTSINNTNGELTFGGIDFTKYTGSITYTPVTSTKPSSTFWGIDQSVAYGDEMILSETAGIVDTGSTLILLASNAYSAYKSATDATEDEASGFLTLTSSQYDNLRNLNFNIGSETYTLTPNGQIWPRALNTYIGGSSDTIYSIVNNIGTPSGQGLDFINGQVFLERFYSVFDTTNQRIGFARTKFTDATIN